jgi:uncharacterized protein (TIGR03435 family)
LKVHYETREMTGYDLLAAKGGAKLVASSPDNKATSLGVFVLSGKERAFSGQRQSHSWPG